MTKSGAQDDRSFGGRDRLILVAMRLFAERGFDAVTVRDLAAEASVSVGLINHHFGSKQGLREAVDAYFASRTSVAINRAIETLASMDVERIGAFQRDWIIRTAAEWPPFTAYLRRAILENSPWGRNLVWRYYDSIRRVIDRLDAQGRVAPEIDRLLLPMLYLFVLTGPIIFRPWIEETFGVSGLDPELLARLARASTSVFWHGAARRAKNDSSP